MRRPNVTGSVDASGRAYSPVDLLTWLGEGKRFIAGVTVGATAALLAYSLTLAPIYTARTSLLPPGPQLYGESAAALAAQGSLGGASEKTPDELYVSLLNSDSVIRALDQRFDLKAHYRISSHEALRKALPQIVRVSTDTTTGVINIEVDDGDPTFAATLANAQASEVTNLLGRLAVGEARRRRVFFDHQLIKIKEDVAEAELAVREVQEATGVIVPDKQTEALLASVDQVRARIAESEVRLKVLRIGTTEQHHSVVDVRAELRALRAELVRIQTAAGGGPGRGAYPPLGKMPEVSIEYMRARRNLNLQEALLETTRRQLELARLDEARDGPVLRQIDIALPPEYRSDRSRASFVGGGALLATLASAAWVAIRRCAALDRAQDPTGAAAWRSVRQAWRLRA